MTKTRAFTPRTVVLILLLSIVLALICNALFSCVDRLIYPEDYYDIVMKYSSEYAVPAELVFAIIKVESNFESNTVSSAGAIGLMQILPSTYEYISEMLGEPTLSSSVLYDPQVNIKYGTYYLQYLYSKFGSWEKAIVAYNMGETRLAKLIVDGEYIEGDYSTIPYEETRGYIKKVTHHWDKYKDLYSE